MLFYIILGSLFAVYALDLIWLVVVAAMARRSGGGGLRLRSYACRGAATALHPF